MMEPMKPVAKPLTGSEVFHAIQDGRMRRMVLDSVATFILNKIPPTSSPVPVQVPVYVPVGIPTVKGVAIPVSSSLSGSIQKVVSVSGPKAGDVITWSYAKGSPAPAALVPGMAYCLEDGKVTFCFSVTGSLGLSLGSRGSVTVNIAYYTP